MASNRHNNKKNNKKDKKNVPSKDDSPINDPLAIFAPNNRRLRSASRQVSNINNRNNVVILNKKKVIIYFINDYHLLS